jgi:hypothetical protein
MSHIVQIKTQVRDAEAVRLACRRLHLPEPIAGSAKLFSSTVKGLAVQLPGWNYPVVCQLDSGQLQYDNFSGRWGEETDFTASFKRTPSSEPSWRRASKAIPSPSSR